MTKTSEGERISQKGGKMGLKKWLAKHGPGSAGAVSKTMAQSYRVFKDKYPQASQKDLLLLTLKSRIDAWEKLGLPSLTKEKQKKWIEMTEGSLTALILFVLRHENPSLPREALGNFEVLEIIHEVVDKYSPED